MTVLGYETGTGQLTINGVAMRCPAWMVVDLRALWMTAAVRGRDRPAGAGPGVRPKKRHRTLTTHTLEFIITGFCDRSGVLVDCDSGLAAYRIAVATQLQENIDYLRTNVADPTEATDGTRPAVLTMPDASTRAADIHVYGISDAPNQPWHSYKSTLDIGVPQGVFL